MMVPGDMKLLAAIALAGILLAAPAAAASGACSRAAHADGYVIYIGGNSESRGIGTMLKLPITLELRGGSARQLSAELSRLTGRQISFLPIRPDDPVNLDVKDARLWDMLEALSGSGRVQIEGADFTLFQATHQALTGGGKVSVCIKAASVAHVVDELSGLSGKALRVTSGDEKALVTRSAEGITQEGILSRVAEQSGAQVAVQ